MQRGAAGFAALAQLASGAGHRAQQQGQAEGKDAEGDDDLDQGEAALPRPARCRKSNSSRGTSIRGLAPVRVYDGPFTIEGAGDAARTTILNLGGAILFRPYGTRGWRDAGVPTTEVVGYCISSLRDSICTGG